MNKVNSNYFYGLIIISILQLNSCEKGMYEVTDYDGNIYSSVKIGKQVWMVENLKVTRYRNGDPIETTIPDTLNITGENAPKYQWAYDGDESNAVSYGRLYTWFAVTDSRGVCPTGWHVPSFDEWTALQNYLGGIDKAGGKLKELGTLHWNSPNHGATNQNGFTALPGGWRSELGIFLDIGNEAIWYCSSGYCKDYPGIGISCHADSWGLWYGGGNVVGIISGGKSGFSVRCLKD